jgi:protein O-mannosyl-transferase
VRQSVRRAGAESKIGAARPPPGQAARNWTILQSPIVHAVAIAALVTAAYLPSFRGLFVFDDYAGIVDNRLIRQILPLRRFFDSSQPVVDFSFALNYAAVALDPWGYHLVNLGIHLAAALVLYGVVRRTPRGNGLLAFAIAAIWAIHPIQTESVTYLAQRSESLMGLLYLLTLYCAIRGMGSPRAPIWYAASVVACALGMATKAVMVTAPVIVLLYDRCFAAGSFRAALQRRWGLYVGLAATWSVLFALGVVRGVMDTPQPEPPTVGFGYKGVTPLEYLRTQPGVILHYLVLSFWPMRLCLDYGWPVAGTTWWNLALVAAIVFLIAASVLAYSRRAVAGFLGLAFFLVLLPTSSFIPIKDLAFEHRMYLPLAALVSLVVLGTWRWASTRAEWRRPSIALATIAIIALSAVTWGRNTLYSDPVELWRNTVATAPQNPRPHNALGYALLTRRGDVTGAMVKFDEALRLDPKYAGAYANKAEAFLHQRRYGDAAQAFQTAFEINPQGLSARVRSLYGAALLELGRHDEAIEQLTAAISRDPALTTAYYNLGNTLRVTGQRESAVAVYLDALKVDPAFAEARVNLGLTLAALGRHQEAIAAYRAVLTAAPNQKHDVLVKAAYNLGLSLRSLNRHQEAVTAFRAVLELKPDHARAKAELESMSQATP